MPSVTQVLYSGLGGHGSVVFSMIEADINREIEHRLIFYGIEDLKEEYIEKCQALGVPYIFVKKKKGFDFRAFHQVFRALRKLNSQTIMLHNTSLILLVIFYRIFHKVGLMFIEHNPNQVKKRIEKLWSVLGMRFAGSVIYLTKIYEEEMRRQLGGWYVTRKVKVIPNGIDIDFYSPAFVNRDGDEVLVFSMIARFTPTKDHRTLIKAFGAWHLNERSRDARLILAGDGVTRGPLMEFAKKTAPGVDIEFPGTLDETGVVDLLRKTDVYIHSSLGETMSTSIMQAMSCGLPLVASDVPGINNVVDNENGLLFPARDADILASLLSSVANDPEQRKSLSERARHFAVDHFSAKKMFREYLEVIRKIGNK